MIHDTPSTILGNKPTFNVFSKSILGQKPTKPRFSLLFAERQINPFVAIFRKVTAEGVLQVTGV